WDRRGVASSIERLRKAGLPSVIDRLPARLVETVRRQECVAPGSGPAKPDDEAGVRVKIGLGLVRGHHRRTYRAARAHGTPPMNPSTDPRRARLSGDGPGVDDPWAPRWMLDLERALDGLRRASQLLESHAQVEGEGGPTDLRPAARALENAHEALFDAFDQRRPRLEATGAALGALDEAIDQLSPAATVDPAVGFALEDLRAAKAALLEAADRLAPLVPRVPEPAPELRASQEVPVLHAIDRPSLKPRLRVPEPPPPEVTKTPEVIERPKTFEDLAVAVKALKERANARRSPPPDPATALPIESPDESPDPPFGFAEDVGRALSETDFVRGRVRECFEEVAMIGTQRAPLLGDPWRFARVLERRMLASIDAIVAIGPRALEALEPLVFDAPLKDPSRVFALGMILGCVRGRDALAMVERVFFAFDRADPAHAEQFAAALKLVPHPDVPVAMRTLLASGDPAHRALAIDVLAYRGMATEDELARAAVDEPVVAAASLASLAVLRSPSLAVAVDRGLESDDARLRDAARLAMVLSGDRRAVGTLQSALAGKGPGRRNAEVAAGLLALVAETRDSELLLERATAAPPRALVTAVGWAGAPTSVPSLLGLLEHADDAVVLAAAYALDRLTNAGLYEDAIVDAEDIQVPDVPEPEVDLGGATRPALARVGSDPRDQPAEPATETLRRPPTDPERWRAYWREGGESYDPKSRYRRGYLYTPLVSWREVDQFPCTPGERRLLQTELVARTGEYVRFDPHDFVPTQEAAIAQWEAVARRASGNPGSWLLPMRRSGTSRRGWG